MRLEQDPIHRHKDVLAHTIAVVENVRPDARPDFDFRRTRLAALFHDVGKPKTRSYRKGKGVAFHHHEVVGARMTRERMQALRYSNDDIDAVTRLVELHLRFHTYAMGWTDAAVRRFARDAGDLLDELIVLTRCDCTTRNERRAGAAGAAHGRAGGADRRAGRGGGAARHPARPRRQRRDGPPRHRARAGRRRGAGVPARGPPRRRARSARTRPTAASTPGGRA